MKTIRNIIFRFMRRRAVVLPLRPFHPEPIPQAGLVLFDQRENEVLRAVMLLLEQHIGDRMDRALLEAHQQFPAIAAHMAGAAESLLVLHGAIISLVDGRTKWEPETRKPNQ